MKDTMILSNWIRPVALLGLVMLLVATGFGEERYLRQPTTTNLETARLTIPNDDSVLVLPGSVKLLSTPQPGA